MCDSLEPVQLQFGVALVELSATYGEIKACERGQRAGQRAHDRLTPSLPSYKAGGRAQRAGQRAHDRLTLGYMSVIPAWGPSAQASALMID